MSAQVEGECDLTPMLDMVFQLITFFMLVSNFKAAELDMNLKLPVVGSARPVDTKGKEEFLILNIDIKGTLKVYGIEKDIESYIAGEAAVVRDKKPELKKGDELPVTVVIRADRGTPFKMLNKVITTSQDNGFLKYAMRAMEKDDAS